MKVGCCTTLDQASMLYAAGFDFIECSVVSLAPEQDVALFTDILKKHHDSPLQVEACNVFLPGDLKIVGHLVDQNRIKKYVETALYRVHQIGSSIVVFGSGGARSFPNGFSQERAENQIIQFLNLVADYAEPLGITIVIEPLNQKESNMINSVREAYAVAEKVNRRSIQVLADFYHMDEEKEPLEHIILAKGKIKHIHVADTNRLAPGTGNYPYEHFVHCLKQADYNGRISIECKWNDFNEEIVQARSFLQRIFTI